ncbi:vacuolar amino acid permease [Rhizoctonia solani]|uniref:Vacuolar amino acid permease n=1 Tax=Rhizoctonia solani TaxID=456999 RepID=A0A8H7M9D1_9AGAM|nr:vacuolar amino acid permease [Rhizoctonia solani]
MSNTPVDERQALLTKNDGGTPIVQEYGTASSSGTSTPSIVKPSAINSPSGTDLLWILGGLWSAVFLGALDTTIVATLVSPIGSYFQKSHQASYLGTSYLLSVCCFTPLYGIGTLLCGIATSMEFLIFARAVAGMGGGGVMTVTDIIPLYVRAFLTSEYAVEILFGLGSGIGGPVGGWINDTFGWRTAFLIQIPILVLSAIVITFKVNIKLPETKQTARQKLARIDYAGSFTLVVCVGSLLLGLSLKTGEDLKWSSPIVVSLLCLSAVFAVVFVLVEAKWAPEPVMPMRLLTMRTPFFVAVSNFCMSCYAFSMLYNVPLYFSAVRLNSASESGLHLLPNAVGLVLLSRVVASLLGGKMMRRTGKLYWLTIASAAGALLSAALISSWNESTHHLHLWLDIAFGGFGMSSLITSTLIALIASVDKKDYAVATGSETTGQVLGVSLSGALVQAVLVSSLRKGIQGPNAEKIIQSIRHSTAIIPTLDPPLRVVAIQSYQRALTTVFTCQVVLAFVLMLSCLPIEENPLPGSHEEQEQQERLRRERNGRVAA